MDISVEYVSVMWHLYLFILPLHRITSAHNSGVVKAIAITIGSDYDPGVVRDRTFCYYSLPLLCPFFCRKLQNIQENPV